MPNIADETHQWLRKEFGSGIALAFEGMLGERPTVEASAETAPPPADCIAWRQPFAEMSGEAWLASSEQVWLDA